MRFHHTPDWRFLEVGDRRWPIQSFDNNNSDFGDYKHYNRQVKLLFENGWLLSIVWGSATYSDNYDYGWDDREFVEAPATVEIAAWNHRLGHEMCTWPGGDTVYAYLPVADLAAIVDLVDSQPSTAIELQPTRKAITHVP